MIRQELTLINRLGLHARAAAKLVATASRFSSAVRLGRTEKLADAKSIMAVMMLGASCGTTLVFETEGADEALAMDAIASLIKDRFGEDE